MNIHNGKSLAPRSNGFALVVAILLLLILSIFSLFAVNVGFTEQRTTVADARSKAVQQVADAAMNQGVEAIKVLNKTIGPKKGEIVGAGLWELCAATDTTFPCGAEADPTRRAMMYRYIGGVDLDGDGTVSLYERRSINLPWVNKITGTDGRLLIDSVPSANSASPFPVNYQVGMLLCRADMDANPGAVPPDTGCTTILSRTSDILAYTLVARAQMTGEQANATVVKTIVPIVAPSINPKVPSLVASGVISGLGTSTIVPNPNSAGPGIPISVWSRLDFKSTGGTWQSCHMERWLRESDIVIHEDIPVCKPGGGSKCTCGSDTLSGGGSGDINENMDILDIDSNAGVLRDTQEFPCDLMEFVFGVRVRENTVLETGGKPQFCEDGEAVGANTNGDPITDNKKANEFLREQFEEIKSCADVPAKLNAASSGFYWVSADNCKLPNSDVGSPNHPVVVVFDGGIDTSTSSRVFGLVFGRDPRADISAADGGQATINPGGGTSEIYGAMVVEGDGTVNGNVDLIYSLKTLQTGESMDRDDNAGNVPGSWTDRVSY